MISVRLNKGKDKAVRQLHPWVFSGAIDTMTAKPENGEIVRVIDQSGSFLAYGFFNDNSRVAIRLLEWDENTEVNEEWWKGRLKKAIDARRSILNDQTDTCRLVFSEADYLPGLIVDKYADYLSLQILTSGIEKIKPLILEVLKDLLEPKGIFDRSDASARAHEGMPASSGGVLSGELPPVLT